MITVIVHGVPAPKGSKSRGSGGAMYESSSLLPAWDTALDVALMRARSGVGVRWPGVIMPRPTPCTVGLGFTLHRPKRIQPWSDEWPTGKPDIDKLARAVLDALTRCKYWTDDAQCVQLVTTKHYVLCDQGMGATGAAIDLDRKTS